MDPHLSRQPVQRADPGRRKGPRPGIVDPGNAAFRLVRVRRRVPRRGRSVDIGDGEGTEPETDTKIGWGKAPMTTRHRSWDPTCRVQKAGVSWGQTDRSDGTEALTCSLPRGGMTRPIPGKAPELADAAEE